MWVLYNNLEFYVHDESQHWIFNLTPKWALFYSSFHVFPQARQCNLSTIISARSFIPHTSPFIISLFLLVTVPSISTSLLPQVHNLDEALLPDVMSRVISFSISSHFVLDFFLLLSLPSLASKTWFQTLIGGFCFRWYGLDGCVTAMSETGSVRFLGESVDFRLYRLAKSSRSLGFCSMRSRSGKAISRMNPPSESSLADFCWGKLLFLCPGYCFLNGRNISPWDEFNSKASGSSAVAANWNDRADSSPISLCNSTNASANNSCTCGNCFSSRLRSTKSEDLFLETLPVSAVVDRECLLRWTPVV